MSRTIKFRVWSPFYKTIQYSHDGWNEEADVLSGVWISIRELGYKVMEFSGIQDKNGRDIYEGDIVKYSVKYDEHGDREDRISTVVFEDGAFGLEEGHFCNLQCYPHFSCEVIGNIFENSLDELREQLKLSEEGVEF